jgi:hypothetical protein
MLERDIHWIYIIYAVKGVIIEKLMKLDNVCYFFIFLNYVNFNLIANANNFFYTGPWDRHGLD